MLDDLSNLQPAQAEVLHQFCFLRCLECADCGILCLAAITPCGWFAPCSAHVIHPSSASCIVLCSRWSRCMPTSCCSAQQVSCCGRGLCAHLPLNIPSTYTLNVLTVVCNCSTGIIVYDLYTIVAPCKKFESSFA